MPATSETRQHSAQVEMELHIDGRTFPVTQLAPDFLILKTLVELPAGEGEIAIRIDGRQTRFPIRLEFGATPSQLKTPITPVTADRAAPLHLEAASPAA